MDPLCTLLRFRKLQLYIEKQFEDGSTSKQLVSIRKTEFGRNSTAAHLPIAFASVPRSFYLSPPYCLYFSKSRDLLVHHGKEAVRSWVASVFGV
jgi:hypothetical protein